jgi:hypothetical protein
MQPRCHLHYLPSSCSDHWYGGMLVCLRALKSVLTILLLVPVSPPTMMHHHPSETVPTASRV